jgi:DnaJ-class molecular chaperone
MKDYYKILGIDNKASSSEIKRTFRRMALLVHPDKSASDTKDAFIALFEAYEILSDRKKRKRYDKLYPLVFTSEEKHLNLEKELRQISQMGHVYASDFRKFDKEILGWIIVDLFFDTNSVLFASFVAIFFGIWTIVKGLMTLKWDYALIGLGLAIVGLILARLRILDVQKTDR